MSITSLRPLARAQAIPIRARIGWANAPPETTKVIHTENFAIALLRAGHISAEQLMRALAAQARHKRHLIDCLLAMRALPEQTLYTALAQHFAIGLVDFTKSLPEPALIAQCDPKVCIRQAWVPWRKLGQTTVIVCAYPEDFSTLQPSIEAIFGPVILAIAPRSQIESAVLARAGAGLAYRAETRVAPADSCRSYQTKPLLKFMLIFILGMTVFALLLPSAAILTFLAVALFFAYAQITLKVLAVLNRDTQTPAAADVSNTDLPMMSIMVALYKESRIVARLIRATGLR